MIEVLPKLTYAKNSPRKPFCGGESIIGGGSATEERGGGSLEEQIFLSDIGNVAV